ncbi:MAG: T9SS sorting signal type C domain-containing protein [Sphingobacteriales bacterium]|nr:MAG: T9SS sorting signal type C domain-containing protein [Sphingobacteriales bacterium]
MVQTVNNTPKKKTMNAKLPNFNKAVQQPAGFLKLLALMLILIVGSGTSMFGQVSAYQVEQLQLPTYTDLDVNTKTAVTSGVWDNNVTNIPIGFTFKFNGVNYTTANVSANGFITFGATAPALTTTTPISSTETYSGAISGFGYNWLVSTSAGTPQANNVSYFLDSSGGVGNRILIIEYRSVKRNTTDGANVSFQIWLYETTNVVEVHFATQSVSFTSNVNGEVGLRGASNADFNNLAWAPNTWPGPATMADISSGTNTNASLVGIRSGGSNRIPATANRLFRWTPVSCVAPTLVTISNIAASTATVSWTAPTPAPANGYQIYYSTSSTAPNGATAPTTTSATNTVGLTGLPSNSTIYVWVRSDCGGTTSAWTPVTSFTTLCTAVNVPYTGMYFDEMDATQGYTIPALPPCTSIQNVGLGNNWVTDATLEEGMMDEHLMYNASGTQAANVWFFTKGINLVAGSTYRLSYQYGGSTNFAFITNKMEVAYGTSPQASSMTTQLADHTNIKASPIDNVVNFTATATGTYYFGFRAYSAANQGRLFLDNIEVVPSICNRPLAATISSVGYNSAVATWTATSPAPAGGYFYYLSTSPTPPTYTTVATGSTPAGVNSVNLSGLNGATTYYFWVRGNCGSPDASEWSPVVSFTTGATPPYCTPTSTLNTSYISNFTTTNAVTNVNNSSAYSTGGYGDYTNLMVTESQGGNLNFSVSIVGPTVGVAIWVDWNGNGVFTDPGETMYNSGTYLTGPVNGNFTVPAGAPLGVTRMRVMVDYWATNPTPCAFGTVSTTRGEIEDYSFKVVVPPPAITLNINSSTQCAGTASPSISLTSAPGNFNTYSWSPSSGVSGGPTGPWTITSGTAQVYTLTGTQTVAPFSVNTVQFSYNANPLPTPINITATNSGTACQNGTAVLLTASGGVVSGVPVYSENFNSGAPGWTETHGTTTGYLNSIWTIRPDGYGPTGPSWFGTVLHSNDNSSFYFSDNDAQGIGNPNDNKLISPVFSLAGYTAASLSFWHFYRQWNGTGKVEISTNGGGSYVTLQTFNSSQGTTTNWSNVIIDLNAYVGQANLRIRFNYIDNWGWGWGIDNFVISGSATSAITWTPNGAGSGLFTDAAATVPYTGAGAISVYALPNATTTYTASASTPSPTVCTTSTATTVTITPNAGGSVTPPTQTVCGNPTALTLAGQTGPVTQWEWSTSPTFATIGGTIANTTTTLTPAQIGSFAGTRYYRAVSTNGSCTAYSYAPTAPTYASVSYTSTTWNGAAWSAGPPNSSTAAIFAGNYTGAANLSACSVTVNSGNVVFNSNRTLTVQNAVNVVGGTLTFNNNASLVQVNDSAVNTGYITYKRDSQPMIMYDYTYWSSPLTPQTLVGLSPLTMADKYFRFNASANTYVNVAANSLMAAGTGYIIRAPQNFTATPTVFNGVFNGGANDGVPNNGIITTPIVGPGPNNFNLVGNPYPSAIDADLVFAGNNTKIDGSFYFWTHNTPINPTQYTQSDYAVYNAVGGVGTAGGGTGNSTVPSGNIASGQAFFVKGLTNSNLTFNNSMRLTGLNNEFFRQDGVASPAELEKHRVWLEVKNSLGAYKQILVGYVENATNAKDVGFDADAVDAGNVAGLYSILGSDKLAIQGRALPFDVNDQVPVGFKSTIAGNFEIALSNFDGLFTTQNIYLEDKSLNIIHDLKSGSYNFSTLAGTFDDRFVLRFTNDTALGVNHAQADNAVIVYKNDNGINVISGSMVMKSIKIFDLRGREIFVKDHVNSNEALISNLNAGEQVLLVQITSNDNQIVNRKIVY